MAKITAQARGSIVIHFAGDSGDGVQVLGAQLAQGCAELGNDLQTFPDFPAEIRAPAGTLPGVSGFQLRFADQKIHTPGDRIDILVALNPAALKVNLSRLQPKGMLIVDSHKFTEREWKKAGYTQDPLTLPEVAVYNPCCVDITDLTLKALENQEVSRTQARKCKNFFALGIIYWLFGRSIENTETWLHKRFAKNPALGLANSTALKTGYFYAETAELFTYQIDVGQAPLPEGHYRQITGNEAFVLGCLAVQQRSTAPFFMAGYPITPASQILHDLSQYVHLGLHTFQAEDEIAAMGAALGAAYGGALALSCTSGPGLDLKMETLGLAVMVELPVVVIDVQRAGPSTGMPTKVEQSDLALALHGRHGEAPVVVLAPATPGDCFTMLLEAFRLAVRAMVPVIVLSDACLANSAEPWIIPDPESLPTFNPTYSEKAPDFMPYERNPDSLARPWAIPGTPEMMHRIGGLEKEYPSGKISYDGPNHAKMVALRQAKVERLQEVLPPLVPYGNLASPLLVVTWGSASGAVRAALEGLATEGHALAAVEIRYINPFQKELASILKQYARVVVVELNSGQLCAKLREMFLVDARAITKIQGRPFEVEELKAELLKHLNNEVTV